MYYFTSYHWTYFGFVKHILLHFSSSWPTRVRFVYSWADDTKAKTQYTEYSASLYASLINEMPNIHKVLHTIHVSITYLTHSFATPLIHSGVASDSFICNNLSDSFICNTTHSQGTTGSSSTVNSLRSRAETQCQTYTKFSTLFTLHYSCVLHYSLYFTLQ